MGTEGTALTSVRKRLDKVLNELSTMTVEPDEKASGNVAAELKVIKAAFKESEHYPVCCFRYDAANRIVCDFAGPLALEQFMKKCRECQTHIRGALLHLQMDEA